MRKYLLTLFILLCHSANACPDFVKVAVNNSDHYNIIPLDNILMVTVFTDGQLPDMYITLKECRDDCEWIQVKRNEEDIEAVSDALLCDQKG